MILSSSFGAELVVDKSGAGDFTKIQTAVNAAVEGDTIKIRPGNYSEQVIIDKQITLEGSGYLNTSLDYSLGDAIAVTSPKGAIIKGLWITASQNGIYTVAANTSPNPDIPPGGSTAISNCVISNCGSSAISFNGDGALDVKNTIIQNCGASGIFGAKSYQYQTETGYIHPTFTANIQNCVIVNNGGHGIGIQPQTARITNCTIMNNAGSGVATTTSGTLSILNSIICNNTKYALENGGNVSYSNLWNNKEGKVKYNSTEGMGIIEQDPLLTDDYKLQPGSPCIDAGDPFPGSNDPDGTRNDMGAYGGPGAANWDSGSVTPPVTPPGPGVPVTISPTIVYPFSGATSDANKLVLFPPGSPGEFNLGDVYFRPLTTKTGDEDYTDGFGVSAILDPGEGVTFYAAPLPAGEDYVYLRIGAWCTESTVSLAVGALDAVAGNNLASAALNGSIEANILMNAGRCKNKFGYLEAFYKCERGAIVPVFQAANSPDAARVTVQFDNLEIFRISKDQMPTFSSGNQAGAKRFFRLGDRLVFENY